MKSPFGTRPANRRRNRRDELDVLLAANTGARRSPGRWWAGPLLFLVLAGLLYAGGGWVVQLVRERWLHRIDRLALRHIEVVRDGLLSEDEIRLLAGVEVGRNALTVDPFRVRERLRRHPRIEEAQIRIDFPDTLHIAVRERVPVARLMLPRLGSAETYLLVDDLGSVFLPFNRGAVPTDVIESEASLPTLLGVNAVGAAAGRPLADPQVLAALRLLATFDESPLVSLADIINVDVATPPVLTLLTRGGSQVTLAADREFGDQLWKWYSVHRHGLESGLLIASLDLSITNNPPLRWVETPPSTNSVPAVNPTRDSRPKRKPHRRHA